MTNQASGAIRKRSWLRYAMIALGAIFLVELPFVVLALNSTIPCQGYWVSDGQGGTTILRYWDGRTVISSHAHRPTWVTVQMAILLVLAVCWTALWVILGVRWFRRWRDRGYPWQFRFSLSSLFWTTVLAGVCLATVTLIEPESPPLLRVLQAGVMVWMAGCGVFLRRWLRSRSATQGGDVPGSNRQEQQPRMHPTSDRP